MSRDSESFNLELKLIALDAEDLAVISAQLQDAVLRVEDMVFQSGAHRFAAVVNRFNWLAALKTPVSRLGRRQPTFERRQAALRFERVRKAQHQGLDLSDKRRVLSILALRFESDGPDTPEGSIVMIFAGGGAIRLEVECIECELRDLGAVWATRSRPQHPLPPDERADAQQEASGQEDGSPSTPSARLSGKQPDSGA